MNVYPVNLLAGGDPASYEMAPYSNMRYLYHPYMKHRSWFISLTPVINAHWSPGQEADTVIIADTNAAKASIQVNGADIFGNEDLIPGINIFNLPNILDFGSPAELINSVEITLDGGPNPTYLGYLFVGKRVELPRFTVGLEWETQIRGDAARTNFGQAYGVALPTLDRLSVQFERIHKSDKKILDDYVQAVLTVVPHVVDLYPEAYGDFSPRYATLASSVSAQKRYEGGFYWDLNLEWIEAR